MTNPKSQSKRLSATHVLYLHGFRSSPQSFKARTLAGWLAEKAPALHWWCPQLPASPAAAWALAQGGTADWPVASMAVVGSSLGGFYATCMAERRGCAALLLNPAVDPARDLARHVGVQSQYHAPEQSFEFLPGYLDELRAMAPASITRPERYSAIISKGDELLDWREMCGRYPGANIRLLDGSDHALADFEDHLDFVAEFLGLVG